jgi:succinate dehydrogenase / fumarate reductase iron-sulfur subunit
MKLKVRRGAGQSVQGVSFYDTFELSPAPGATVLSLLFEARDRFDDSLAFRYSCRGAVCGSCAMLINRVPRLACRTQVAQLLSGGMDVELKPYPAIEGGERWDASEEVLVEPLPHLPVLKDLVVDMTRFFRFLRAVRPALEPAADAPEHEFRMDPSAVKELEQYTNCILCGACYGACPVCGENPEYLGPAALAQLYRFHIDPREARDGSRLVLADKPDGWWACRFYTNCRAVCPKGVPPNIAIGRARHELGAVNREDRAEGRADAEN